MEDGTYSGNKWRKLSKSMQLAGDLAGIVEKTMTSGLGMIGHMMNNNLVKGTTACDRETITFIEKLEGMLKRLKEEQMLCVTDEEEKEYDNTFRAELKPELCKTTRTGVVHRSWYKIRENKNNQKLETCSNFAKNSNQVDTQKHHPILGVKVKLSKKVRSLSLLYDFN